ncbi:nitroreductase family protein [Actinoplanes sp. NPDC051343]|uniref:nitroreductase family protein n=1 Tax=Actinoplanes sp. NPDC051343 TaxID=3363906 RepID=UPI0037AF4BB4
MAFAGGREDKTMDVYEAVNSRRAVRAFSSDPVPEEALERVLTAATRAPSSGNLQPWLLYVVSGKPLAELKRRATTRARAGDPGDERDYPMYPVDLISPYGKTVSQIVGAGDDLLLFCGVSVGFEKAGVPGPRTGRADMAETVRFIGA